MRKNQQMSLMHPIKTATTTKEKTAALTHAARVAEAALLTTMRDAVPHQKKVDGKLTLHPYLRNRVAKAEKVAARRAKAAKK